MDNIIGGYNGQVIYVLPVFGHVLTFRHNRAGAGFAVFTYNGSNYALDVTNFAVLRKTSAAWYLISPTNGV